MARKSLGAPCIVGALTENWPFVFAVNENHTDAWYGPGHGPWEPSQVVGSVAAIVAPVESNSSGTSSVSFVALATPSLPGTAAAAVWAVAASSAKATARTPIRRALAGVRCVRIAIRITIPSCLGAHRPALLPGASPARAVIPSNRRPTVTSLGVADDDFVRSSAERSL